MTSKEVQLFILRHLEAGNTTAEPHILNDITDESQRKHAFIAALKAIKNRSFLCPGHNDSNKPSLWDAYVSTDGRAFIRENTPEPPAQIIVRHSMRWIEMILIAVITSATGVLANVLITLYLTGKFG
jgi:hypothetical protein